MKSKLFRCFPFLILLLAFVSPNQWSLIPLGTTFTNWILYTIIVIAMINAKNVNKLSFNNVDYKIVSIFLLVAVIGIVRGIYVADNYWEYKSLVGYSFILLFPLIVFAFNNPYLVQRVYRMWMVYGLIAFALFFYWNVGITQFYLGPVYFITCFLPLIPKKKWGIVFLVLIVILATYDIEDQRSQFIKAIITILIALSCIFKKFITDNMLRIAHWLLYITPIILIVLGVSGIFNVFSDTSNKYNGKYVSTKNDVTADMSNDTRSFIYYEVLTSAINNKYVIFGRTPARGNDTNAFYNLADNLMSMKAVRNIKRERGSNELCFLNIFTWLGLIGMFLYIAIYLRASFMGVYRSNNFYVKMAGIVTAFNFCYGWVENTTCFDILNVVYWTFISICLSSKFRNMTNKEFECWYKGIFVRK